MSDTKTKGVLLMSGVVSPIIGRGMERIRQKAPSSVDILHDRAPTDPVFDEYS